MLSLFMANFAERKMDKGRRNCDETEYESFKFIACSYDDVKKLLSIIKILLYGG